MAAFHTSTVEYLRNELGNLTRWRKGEEGDLAGHRTRVEKCEATIAFIDARVSDLEGLLAYVEAVNSADDEALGREIDAAVESTGHLPGHAEIEHFDQAEADDVRAIRREMAIEAGDFDPADECDYPLPGEESYDPFGGVL